MRTAQATRPAIKALVFDAYGTLFDVHSVVAACDARFSGQGQAVSRLWRAKQLEYSWLLSLMGRYENFWSVTERALIFACKALELACDPADRARLMEQYLRLDLYPDARDALRDLAGYPLAILSNGAPAMLRAVVDHAGLGKTFARVISVDELRVYKPDMRVYRHAADTLGVTPEQVGFVSANSFDACGATCAGFQTFWINRAGQPPDELGVAPAVMVGQLTDIVDLLKA